MRSLFACALASAALATASCGASSERSQNSDSNTGEGGELEDDGGSVRAGSAAGGRTGRGGSSSSAGSSAAGTGSSAGSGGNFAMDPGNAGSAASGSGATGQFAQAGAAGSSLDAGGAGGSDDFPGHAGEVNTGGMANGAGTGGSELGPPVAGECTAPCELMLGPAANLPGDSAVVVYDFESNTAKLTSDPAVSAASEWVIGFSYESDPEYGYGAWSTGGWWFAFTEPLEYVDDTYSMKQNVEITSQMVNPGQDRSLRLVYSFGDETVRIHAIGVPDCDAATSGACASASDCGPVDAGMLRDAAEECSATCNGGTECIASCLAEGQELSLGCSTCYADFLACATNSCPTECPGMGGNACMTCETDAGCHTAFMACSGLDYMPRGTLTWPLAQTY